MILISSSHEYSAEHVKGSESCTISYTYLLQHRVLQELDALLCRRLAQQRKNQQKSRGPALLVPPKSTQLAPTTLTSAIFGPLCSKACRKSLATRALLHGEPTS